MKIVLFLLCVYISLALEAQHLPLYPGYIPESIPYDNPAVPLKNTELLPSSPDCVIRPSVVQEVKKMRLDAAYIASMIEKEVHIMERRKIYVEQMTNYLNDRIKELNQVKSELRAESSWIGIMQKRIAELQEKEKLIKLEDIQTCLADTKGRLGSAAGVADSGISGLSEQATAIRSRITSIGNEIKNLECGIDAKTGKPMTWANGACTVGTGGSG